MNANWLICFALVVSTIHVIECKGGRGGGRSHGRSSHGSSRGSHSSHGSSGGSSRGSSSSGSSHTYPGGSSYSGHGSGGSHTYPQSPGYSGHGSGGSHTYPQSPGYSGHGSGGSHGYHGYSGSGSQPWGTAYHAPSYYSSPQHIYVTQYRDSGSRYNDILTGLTMYNLGRSHSHYHHHYYHDSYYRSTAPRPQDQYSGGTVDDPNDEATCFLKMRKNSQEEVVKVPCAIVSTFSNENNITSDMNQNNVTSVQNCSSVENVLLNRLDENNILNNSKTISCINSTTNVEDPLTVKGAPIDAENMECLVEIRTKERVMQNNMDCEILLKYAKMPVPKKEATGVLPQREKLKAMLDKPPWWLSLFIAA